MSVLWFVIGLVLGGIYVWLQWMQVKDILPGKAAFRVRVVVYFILRLALFCAVTGLALRVSLLFGLIMFAGFMTSRSFLLMLIGSGHVRFAVRSN